MIHLPSPNLVSNLALPNALLLQISIFFFLYFPTIEKSSVGNVFSDIQNLYRLECPTCVQLEECTGSV